MMQSISELAALTGMGRGTVKNRLALLTPTKEGTALLYESKEALPLLYRVGVDGEALDPPRERALLDRERRLALEMANAKTRGDLIPKEEVARTWVALVTVARGRLLALPGRVAHQVLRLHDLRQIEDTLSGEITLILEELAGGAEEVESVASGPA